MYNRNRLTEVPHVRATKQGFLNILGLIQEINDKMESNVRYYN